MKIRQFVVVCAALGMGATLTLNANQVIVAPTPGTAPSGSFVNLPIQGKVVKGVPYSADFENESIQTLADGNRIVRKTTGRIYRDVEGRVRREEDRPAGDPAITISDPLAGLSWTLTKATKIARESPGFNLSEFARAYSLGTFEAARPAVAPPTGGQVVARSGSGGGGGRGGAVSASGTETRAITPAQTPPVARGGGAGGRMRPSAVEEALANRSIENLLCTGLRRTTTIEKGVIGNEQPIKIVSEEWTSIDLQVLVLTDLNDPRTGRSTYKLLNVRRLDPDLMLFKVPADYTVVRGGARRGGEGN